MIANAKVKIDVGYNNAKIVMLLAFKLNNLLMDFVLMIANAKEFKIVGSIYVKIVTLLSIKELKKQIHANMIVIVKELLDAGMKFVLTVMQKIMKETKMDHAGLIVNAPEIINVSKTLA